ncbi:glycosyltransferase family 87 protein [Antrihabitans sp. YC2-6]|uniref:glycosyltransferase family 87 protein n=1 Tax=Antrihabitans sp. YC2-6 TaxID=2799498 RepID=UPI0018F54DD0|nr:glycosyltransferase 87 family protein [Antrihabitans sp. YC2-6]MBJ8347622.1 DUF2029 domain-containing protein [Antrihabitans sp. YC2-6]
MRSATFARTTTVVLVVFLCGIVLCLAYANKARCAGEPFDDYGRSLVFDQVKDHDVCYSDIQFLWVERGLGQHDFPYINGGITDGGTLTGGTVEYPVLTGVLMWLGGLPAHNDAQFLLASALIMAPFGLAVGLMLGRMSGRAAYLWAIGPPLVLYGFHNWELPVVASAVAAVYVVNATGLGPLRSRAFCAAVLLGFGTCLKLYPAAFVVALMAYVLTGGVGGRELPPGAKGRFDVRGAVVTGAAALATVVAINLPFAIAGFDGWRASFTFQQHREADITTNSIWFWGLRKLFVGGFDTNPTYNALVDVLSPALVLGSFALAIWLGWRRLGSTGTYPWVGVSGAMLCGFLLFHKVFSPQYTLWLIPFLVLVRVPWRAIAAYLVADAAIGVGVFRFYDAISTDGPYNTLARVVEFGVWGRSALLVYFFFVFVRAPLRAPRAPDPVAVKQDNVVEEVSADSGNFVRTG